jgi:hypothetical protein
VEKLDALAVPGNGKVTAGSSERVKPLPSWAAADMLNPMRISTVRRAFLDIVAP